MTRASGLAVGVVMAMSLAALPAAAGAETPTYNAEVGRILLDNCASCHRPNQVAPMSLLSYREARPWARAIKAKVVAREMPPWFADPRWGKFSNDTSLSEADIATITAWVDGGAPEGDGPAPEAPRFSEAGWSHPDGLEPDYVIEFPIAWKIDAEGETPNFNLFTPLPFDDVMHVSATQVRPGNYAATHHITTGLLNAPPGMMVGTGPAWPGGPEVDYVMVPDPDADPDEVAAERKRLAEDRPGPDDPDAAERARARRGFGPYIPGVGADVVRKGQAREVRGDMFDYIVWNLHYQATGKPETARPSIGAWLSTDSGARHERTMTLREYTSENEQLVAPAPPPREEAAEESEESEEESEESEANEEGEESEESARPARRFRQAGQGLNPLLDPIPPHDGNWTVTGIGAFQDDAILQSLFLHMHVRGRDVTYVLTYPDGREEILLRVPNYSFDWQFSYELAEPIHVPAGSTLKAIARYDNSRANRLNPAPHKEVYWSEQSWDDMFLITANYTLEEGND